MSEADETASLFETVAGGRELLDWFSGPPNFGDAELVSLCLDRRGPSRLALKVFKRAASIVVTFVLGDWIDVRISGFSQQNVIEGLTLRRAEEREWQPWELGVGAVPGQIEIDLRPCFGAYGVIRATLSRVTLQLAHSQTD